MMPIFYTTLVLLLAINLLLALPQALDLTQTKVLPNSQPQKVLAENKEIVAPQPRLIPLPRGTALPNLTASSVLVEDLESGFIFFTKDHNKKVPIASTTKIMTALVAVDHFKPNDVLTVTQDSLVAGSTMGLKVGEKLTFRSLLYGMLLNSGNDAAFTIAANYPGGVVKFVEAMNNKTSELGLTNSSFDNPAGFDSPNHFSSATDLSKIAQVASENYQLARVVATKDTVVASIDKSSVHPLKNLNKLLGMPGVLGIKTGTTPAAKENLVGLIEKNGHKILTVVLGSENRFPETEYLIDWVFANFTWQ